MKGRRRQRVGLGDIVEIPLGDFGYAYGRVLRDAGIEVFELAGQQREMPTRASRVEFTVGVDRTALESGDWPVIGNLPFETADAEWPPPFCVRDAITGKPTRYHKGVFSPTTEAECRTLEPAAAWAKHHIVERLLKLAARTTSSDGKVDY